MGNDVTLQELQAIVNHQACQKVLWPMSSDASAATISYALRHLHAVIEGDTVMADIFKEMYWEKE